MFLRLLIVLLLLSGCRKDDDFLKINLPIIPIKQDTVKVDTTKVVQKKKKKFLNIKSWFKKRNKKYETEKSTSNIK